MEPCPAAVVFVVTACVVQIKRAGDSLKEISTS
jgi:hypothetical protein